MGLTGLLAKPTQTLRWVIFGENQSFFQKDSIPVMVLPIGPFSFAEAPPCDSCSWLGPESVNFHAAQYIQEELSKYSTRSLNWVPLQHPLLDSTFDLDSLEKISFPYESYFDGFQFKLIYRQKDRFTTQNIKNLLSKIGGKLGAKYLLFTHQGKVSIQPKSRLSVKGNQSISFYLVYWNVIHSYPEWILQFHFEDKSNFNDPWQKILRPSLGLRVQEMPKLLKQHLAEPVK
jgi:hypothetical protein